MDKIDQAMSNVMDMVEELIDKKSLTSKEREKLKMLLGKLVDEWKKTIIKNSKNDLNHNKNTS